ncbi:CLUMA_CG004919, isoform A [Clunio marinus]|uniref:CLUMA_CG004919, isoform A n=1 Tax=Clunio marinus TaxID=568069 RepID=A0A1J1HTB5_9DIPT|nr:CLUMA_CG004919, isoform A [Clunio marinus]
MHTCYSLLKNVSTLNIEERKIEIKKKSPTMEGNQEENKTEPITVSSPIPHPSPSSSPKPTSNQNDESSTDPKYEKIQTIKVNEISAIGAENKKLSKANTSSVMNSSLNLFQDQSHQNAFTRRRLTMFSTLGIFQLILSILLSAFGGLLLARNASLSSFGSGIWSGIFSGIAGSLGIMNLKPLLNGFLACSLISVATGTLALALTGIGLVRDYNIYQQDPEIFGAITAALALTFLLVLHLFTSLFSVYYSALTLCSK